MYMYTYTAPGHLPRRQLRVRRGLWLVRGVGGEHGAGRGQIPQAGAWRRQWAVERGQGARRPRRLELPLLQPAARPGFVLFLLREAMSSAQPPRAKVGLEAGARLPHLSEGEGGGKSGAGRGGGGRGLHRGGGEESELFCVQEETAHLFAVCSSHT